MSIRKRAWTNKDGKKREAWVFDYFDAAGKRHVEQFPTRGAARERETKVRADLSAGTHVPVTKDSTVQQAGEKWIDECVAKNLRRATLTQYRQHLDQHIVPRIGAVKLGKLDEARVTRFRNSLLEKLSRAMAAKVFTSFKSILKAARVPHLAAGVSLRPKRHAELIVGVDCPTIGELPRIVGAAEPGRQRALVLVLATCGLRSGEVRGLQWQDIHFSDGVLNVSRGVDRWHAVDYPKSSRSKRKVPLLSQTIHELKAWKLATGYARDTDFVFPNTTSRPGQDEHHEMIVREVGRLLKAAAVTQNGAPNGLPKYSGLHTFRHFFASWCLNPKERGGRGRELWEVSRWMGHASQAITEQRYGHWFPGQINEEELAEAEQRLLGSL